MTFSDSPIYMEGQVRCVWVLMHPLSDSRGIETLLLDHLCLNRAGKQANVVTAQGSIRMR